MHEPMKCERVAHSEQFHTKSWSMRFACPCCGKSRRYNTNFLGARFQLECDGKRIVRVEKVKKEMTWLEARAAGLL